MAEHTPTPWRIGGKYMEDAIFADHVVCRCPNSTANAVNWEADAAFIVKAVNNHDALVAALTELHAVVKGECPSLLNEDSGGDAELAMEIERLLASVSEAVEAGK